MTEKEEELFEFFSKYARYQPNINMYYIRYNGEFLCKNEPDELFNLLKEKAKEKGEI